MVDIDRGVGDVYDPDTVHNQVTMKSTTHFGKALKRVGISTLVHLGAFDIIGFLFPLSPTTLDYFPAFLAPFLFISPQSEQRKQRGLQWCTG